jgi:hypothetical protein
MENRKEVLLPGPKLSELLDKNEFNIPPDQELPGINMKLPNVMTGDESSQGVLNETVPM